MFITPRRTLLGLSSTLILLSGSTFLLGGATTIADATLAHAADGGGCGRTATRLAQVPVLDHRHRVGTLTTYLDRAHNRVCADVELQDSAQAGTLRLEANVKGGQRAGTEAGSGTIQVALDYVDCEPTRYRAVVTLLNGSTAHTATLLGRPCGPR